MMHSVIKLIRNTESLFVTFYIAYLVSALEQLHRILDFERSRNQRQGSESFLGKWIFMRWLPVAFLTNGVFIVTHGGIELTTPAFRGRMLQHYTPAPLLWRKYKERAQIHFNETQMSSLDESQHESYTTEGDHIDN